ncbi:endo-1,4-beta-xylanase A [Clostridiales bacterium]|nr:endo-1,4-beta-xylanase A [Clostridiales bacterium]
MKKYIMLFIAMTFSAVLAVPAFAASMSSLVLSGENDSRKQELTLDNVSEDCYGVEITLKMKNDDNLSYEFSNDNNDEGVYTTFKENDGDVTLYIVSKNTPLNNRDKISIGTLSADDRFTIKKAQDLKLLDWELNKTEISSIDVEASENSNGNGSSTSLSNTKGDYKVNISETKNGSVSLKPSSPSRGDEVTITVEPDDGYVLSRIEITDNRGNEIELTKVNDNEYTFIMPASTVDILAVFDIENGDMSGLPLAPTGEVPFGDVHNYDWYYEAVKYVYENGLMSGTDNQTFSPDMTTTRGMIVTILHRMDGKPVSAPSAFIDVASGQYYSDAVAWASANGIVSGYGDGNFGPNDTITREQMASILYRYAQYKGYSLEVSDNGLGRFTDANAISDYAVTAIQWASERGIISGTTDTGLTTLVPGGSATRAQVASILMRFSKNI